MTFKKTIKLFLLEGRPDGRMSCELSNWTGKAYKIPRKLLAACTDREDLSRTGVYLLFGRSETGEEKVYIGEAENVLVRLRQQLREREFWHECIVFISKDENLNKAHIKYLEHSLHAKAMQEGRYQVDNSTQPTRSAISESDQAEMEEFLENIRILVGVLGHKVFEPLLETPVVNARETKRFFLKGRGAEAQGQRHSEGFLVFKGASAALDVTPSVHDYLRASRERLIQEQVMRREGEHYVFQQDYIFGSPSTAAGVVMGRTVNGLEKWKDENGVPLKLVEQEETSIT